MAVDDVSNRTVLSVDDGGMDSQPTGHRSLKPILIGVGLTLAFYGLIPSLPFGRETLARYFCSHPLEYALVGLFFVGLSILTHRFLSLHRESAARRSLVLPESSEGDDLEATITKLESSVDQLPQELRRTVLPSRLRDLCDYLKGTNSASGLESHSRHLSDVAADRLHESYSLLLTINWAVPIIGFLGTVIGITLAIANVTPEQLDTSLDSVTGGLAVAFDTTTVAMSFSLVLVFAYDWLKRSEQQVLVSADDLVLRKVLPLFAGVTNDADPLVQAQTEAAQRLIERTDTLVQKQTDLWKESVDQLRDRWSSTMADQQSQLSESLTNGVGVTLGDHAEQLQQIRGDFLTAFERATEELAKTIEADRESRESSAVASRDEFGQIWQGVSEDFKAVIRAHDAHTEDVIDSLTEKIQQWQSGMERTTQSLDAQSERLERMAASLAQLVEQGELLTRVEGQLSQNLDAVRAAETFEETLHNLTAAVHLLTARAKSKAA